MRRAASRPDFMSWKSNSNNSSMLRDLPSRAKHASSSWFKRWFGSGVAKPQHPQDSSLADQRSTKDGLKDVFSLHRGEGAAFGIGAMVLLAGAAWLSYLQWFVPPPPVDLGPMTAEIQAFVTAEQQYASSKKDTRIVADLQPFDPNALDQAGWMALGLSERQAAGIMRYVDRGGRFRSKADVAKIYTIHAEQFAQLKPFILLPDSSLARSYERGNNQWPTRQRWERSDTSDRQYAPRKEAVVVEVNTADTVLLAEVKGIGPAFARGIVKYREKLGGYVSLDQLSEVFVLKDKPDAVAKLKDLLVLDPLMVRRININTCSEEELSSHPYMWKKWSISRAIIAYRTLHGAFATVEGVKACLVVDEELYQKLAPYLTVGE